MVGDGDDITYESHWNDPETNIKYVTKYISFLIEYYKGDKIAALAAYNFIKFFGKSFIIILSAKIYCTFIIDKTTNTWYNMCSQ